MFCFLRIAVFAVTWFVGRCDWTHAKNHKQTNFLFLMYDDLRPELSIYGRKHVISPNFERLAKRSVVFDNNFVQIAVCNPSRDSLLTGLRPDTTGTYGFQHSSEPHNTIGHRLVKSDYSTAGYGKLRHWDGDDKQIWSHESWQGDWYEYQNLEWSFMNASVQPDAVRTEADFRDHIMTTKAVKGLNTLSKQYEETGKHFMVAVGFKLPHITLHIPQKYYDMYADLDMSAIGNITETNLRFNTSSVPTPSYRCCAENEYRYMNGGGTKRAVKTFDLEDINKGTPMDAYNEIMRGYAAGVTFLDVQLGRLLDEMDSLGLWETTTIVLSSDHGMHNGEKGMWEKWTLFDEATHTPLVVYHPLSPFKGQHYTPVVEAIDIFPTIMDLLQAPFDSRKHCPNHKDTIQKCTPLQGKSLAPVVLGELWDDSLQKKNMATHMREKNLRPQPILGLYSGPVPMAVGDRARAGAGLPVPDRGTAISAGSVAAMLTKGDPMRRLEEEEMALENPVRNPMLATGNRKHRGKKGGGDASQEKGGLFSAFKSFGSGAKEKAVKEHPHAGVTNVNEITFAHDFAITQFWRCLEKRGFKDIDLDIRSNGLLRDRKSRKSPMWQDCSMDEVNWNTDSLIKGKLLLNKDQIMLMGYSMRTVDFRYTAWIDFNSSSLEPVRHDPTYIPLIEELYDHRANSDEHPMADFTHAETHNLATSTTRFPAAADTKASESDEIRGLRATLAGYRKRLLMFLERRVIYAGRGH